MEPRIQNKLANLEIEPPQNTWELLSARLVTEYDPVETHLAHRIEEIAITPPEDLWAAISASLENENEAVPFRPSYEKAAKLFSIPVRKISVAAAVLIVISFAVYLFFPPVVKGPSNPNAGIQADMNPSADKTDAPRSSGEKIKPPVIAQEIVAASSRAVASGQNKNNTAPTTANKRTESNAGVEFKQPDLKAADPALVRALDVVPDASISARPYRDKTGKLVMDLNLITTPGNKYVTVTAPNGEQTRISRKFLPVLTFANTGADNGQFNSTLKQKIQDLKRELLQQASFVPSAANFLDIMELKELLKDK